jgi:peptide/nickel transport system substrate-binding protein
MTMAGSGSESRRGVSRRSFLASGLALGGGLTSLDLLGSGTRPALAQAAGTPKHGGTLVAAAEIDPISLDPHTNSNFSSIQAFDHIYESLTSYDEKTNIVPALAQSWDVTNGGKTYTFKLRPNVKFHNGQPMTAEDVKYSIERVIDPKTASPWKNWLDPIKEMKILDPLTIQMNLDAPFPLLGSFAGMRAAGIIPKGLAEKENLKIKAIGTGPFKLAEYVPQDHVTYARNADYWDKPLPYLDGMVFKILTEENARLAALRAGQIQYAYLSAQGATQLEGVPTVSVMKSPYAWVVLHYINVYAKPLNDARVRRAMRMAVDTNEVIQKAVFGAGVPSGPVPTGYGDWFLDPQTLPYNKPDVEGAKKLLAEAGYPNGGFTIDIKCSPQYPEFVATTLVVQSSLKKIGIDVTVSQMEWGAFVALNTKTIRSGGKEGGQIFASANTFRPDPDGYLYPYFHSQGNLNEGGYNNPKLDPLLAEARSSGNPAERRRLYQQIQRTVLEDSPNWWWYAKFNIEAVSSKVHGYAQSFTGRRLFLKRTWLA